MAVVVDFLLADAAVRAAVNGVEVGKLLLPTPPARVFQISSAISNYTVDAVAAPPVKHKTFRSPRRTLLRRKRRTKRGSSGDDSEDVGDEGFFSGDGGDGPFGGGDGGFGGGGRWDYNRFGEGRDWDESSSSSSDPAFDFVYEVLSWIMLSNCLHFAFKKTLRWAANSIVVAEMGKVSMELAPKIWYLLLHRFLCL